MKKLVLALFLSVILAGGAFAQVQMSAGIGASYGIYNQKNTYKTGDHTIMEVSMDPWDGGAFNVFFDATYITAKAGMFFSSYDYSIGATTTGTSTNTYLSFGLLLKYPIDLGGLSVFPMLGFEYNMFLNYKDKRKNGSITTTTIYERSDMDPTSDMDMLIVQVGLGGDYNLTDQIYLRPSIIWGIDFANSKSDKAIIDDGGKVFKHKLDLGVAIGVKF
jgi:hypothetical protein